MARPGVFIRPVRAVLLRQFLEDILQGAYLRVRGYMALHDVSATLQSSLTTVVTSDTTGLLTLPYHWAEFVHNGRGAVSARGKKFLIFFPNKADDPRTLGGTDYPRTPGSRRSLSQEDLRRFSAINRERRKAGQPPIMVFAKMVKPGKQAMPGKQFYVEGLRLFPQRFDLVRVIDTLNRIVGQTAPNGSRSLVIRL